MYDRHVEKRIARQDYRAIVFPDKSFDAVVDKVIAYLLAVSRMLGESRARSERYLNPLEKSL
ncbi:hypothetical protein NC651_022116 [Populus alba x Populus x berolinensis]|nr:hypothetical protein NC651_022116 [Populus alba x Populus x berolinensis]